MRIQNKIALAVVATLGGAVLAAAPSSAQAHPAAQARHAAATGWLVYIKHGAIHLARANGTHDRTFKKGSWTWPSMDSHGVIAAQGPDGSTSPDDSTGYSVYRFNKSGRKISRVRTPADFSTISCYAYPSNHVALSPNGKYLAYDYSDCTGNFAAWTPARRFKLHTWTDYTAPAWDGAHSLVISHEGVTVTSNQAEIGTWAPGHQARGWSASVADDWATAYHAVASHNGKKVALIEDDAANYFDGVARHVRLVLFTAAGAGKALHKQCSVALPKKQYDQSYGTSGTSMSFSANGAALAWDAENGIWSAKTASLSHCSAHSLHAHLWIRGAIDPYFSPAH
jgi:hypothetical protein